MNNNFTASFNFFNLITIYFILLLIIPLPGVTKEFPAQYIVNGKTLYVRGRAVLRYMVVIKAYKGAFYIEKEVSKNRVLGDYSKRLELEYFHAIKAGDFSSSTRKMIAKNISASQYIKLEKKIERLNNLYKDVKPGDRYSITYIPGKGTTLALNNEALGTIKGYDFSVAIFSIWLGKNPIDRSMKSDLLGE